MVEFIGISSLILDYIGAVIILYGGAIAVVRTLQLEIGKSSDLDYREIQRNFTQKIVFGLDFLIAGDVLRTITTPSLETILLLGSIVGIRTIMVYFLTKEMRELGDGK